MIEIYEDLPEDSEEAFLVLEAQFRQECEAAVKASGEDGDTRIYHTEYIAQVLGAISELGLETEFSSEVPKIENVDYSTYTNFSKDVKNYRTRLGIRFARRRQGYSVQLDTKTKQILGHHIGQMREIFTKLEIEEKHREDLFKRLNDLQEEVDRNRTRYDSLAALSIETAGVIGQTVEKSRLLEIMDAIARVLWGARKEQDQRRLPPPQRPKQIEPPRIQEPAPKKVGKVRQDMDDEIPF
jgi:hypothetical protein